MSVNYKPDGYYTITPYIVTEDVKGLMKFLKDAFDGQVTEEIARDDDPDHVEIRIGDSMLMIGRAHGEHKPATGMFYLYFEDCDQIYKKALEAGATSVMEPKDVFYGDRHGGVQSPDGSTWWIATHIEELSSEEMRKRAKEAGK